MSRLLHLRIDFGSTGTIRGDGKVTRVDSGNYQRAALPQPVELNLRHDFSAPFEVPAVLYLKN